MYIFQIWFLIGYPIWRLPRLTVTPFDAYEYLAWVSLLEAKLIKNQWFFMLIIQNSVYVTILRRNKWIKSINVKVWQILSNGVTVICSWKNEIKKDFSPYYYFYNSIILFISVITYFEPFWHNLRKIIAKTKLVSAYYMTCSILQNTLKHKKRRPAW